MPAHLIDQRGFYETLLPPEFDDMPEFFRRKTLWQPIFVF
jgi:hypothetical protein